MFCLVPTEKKSVLQNRSHLPEVAVRTPADPGSRGAGVNRSFTWEASLLRGGDGGTGKPGFRVRTEGPQPLLREQVSASTGATLPARGRGRVGRWIATASPRGTRVAPTPPLRLRRKAAAAPSPGALSGRRSRLLAGLGAPTPTPASRCELPAPAGVLGSASRRRPRRRAAWGPEAPRKQPETRVEGTLAYIRFAYIFKGSRKQS
ncbi:uncharacterized protein LOC116597638 [Mustela erminea]|uniref:uncharacterized protein LOC116597638 n=1 Tax=Mustela erminea TaxID=36723 RepID=UPI0013868AD8|nr:uncharacterized protein LOC116597638 [Mustela erminea]